MNFFKKEYGLTPNIKSCLEHDIEIEKDLYRILTNNIRIPSISKVIHNKPATIILWTDGTKTVVKCGDNDVYDPEKGIAMCIVKKVLGNKGNYYNTIKKWLPEDYIPSQQKNIKMQLGTFVRIIDKKKYKGKFFDKIGKVDRVRIYNGIVSVGVKFNDEVNSRAEDGVYWFSSNSVACVKDEQDRMCKNCKYISLLIRSQLCASCFNTRNKPNFEARE